MNNLISHLELIDQLIVIDNSKAKSILQKNYVKIRVFM
jgi:hypothetical protein